MKGVYLAILFLLGAWGMHAQERTVENRPYTDLRQMHFGVVVGTHLQDIEFNNVGPLTMTNEDGSVTEALITTDQDRWDPGFHVGVLMETRLSTYFQFRTAPTLYFGSRHLVFHNFTQQNAEGRPMEQRQDLKMVSVACGLDMIYAAKRFNNHRPYITMGLTPMINLSGGKNDIVKLKKYDAYITAGLGCDFYLPFFKLRPELKFMYGLINSLDRKHASGLKDGMLKPYALSVDRSRSKIIALTFYFE